MHRSHDPTSWSVCPARLTTDHCGYARYMERRHSLGQQLAIECRTLYRRTVGHFQYNGVIHLYNIERSNGRPRLGFAFLRRHRCYTYVITALETRVAREQ